MKIQLDMDVLMYPYNSENFRQEWVINGNLLQDRLQPSHVLEVQQVMFQAFNNVVVADYSSQKSQHWSFHHVSLNPYSFELVTVQK